MERPVGQTYHLNTPQVASEALAGDLMLLHFGSGLYYNLCGTGADAGAYLLAGGSVDSTAAALAAHFGIELQRATQDVADFVQLMVAEGLLVAAERSVPSEPMRIAAKIYQPPQFQKYDDMADQLLLDKIDDQSPQVPGPLQI
jgi:hypothetical protein